MKFWTQYDKPKLVDLSKSFANQFRDMEACPGDRPVSENRKNILKSIVHSDKFRLCEWSSVFCEETQKEYRVNGKHTSTVFSELFENANGSSETLRKIQILWTRYTAKTLEDVADLYSTFDSSVSSRTRGDINRSFAGTDAQLRDVSEKVINTSVAGMAFYKLPVSVSHGGARLKVSLSADRARLMLEHKDFVLWFDTLLRTGGKESDAKAMRRSPVAACIFATYLKAPLKAAEFWIAVRDASGINRLSPDRMLNKFLIQSTIDSGAGSRSTTKNIVRGEEMFAKCVHAWNAWRDGKAELGTLKWYPEAKRPSVK